MTLVDQLLVEAGDRTSDRPSSPETIFPRVLEPYFGLPGSIRSRAVPDAEVTSGAQRAPRFE
jgi:hypothetical protein